MSIPKIFIKCRNNPNPGGNLKNKALLKITTAVCGNEQCKLNPQLIFMCDSI